MRITNEKLIEYVDTYRVSISMKSKLDNISQKLYGKMKYNSSDYTHTPRTFLNLYPSEQRVVVATYLKSIQQCISVK